MLIPAITPVGFQTAAKSVKESLIRWGAKSDRRKAAEEIFFIDTASNALADEIASQYATALEMVRIAPSASNKQPWRLNITGNGIHFYLKRTEGYSRMIKGVDLQRIDMGIAMSHFEVACKELSLKGEWHNSDPDSVSVEFGDYLISWKV